MYKSNLHLGCINSYNRIKDHNNSYSLLPLVVSVQLLKRFKMKLSTNSFLRLAIEKNTRSIALVALPRQHNK